MISVLPATFFRAHSNWCSALVSTLRSVFADYCRLQNGNLAIL